MARPRKTVVDFTEQSTKEILQEILNECREQRTKAIYAYNKQFLQAEDVQEIAMIGKITSEYLKIVDQAIDKKLAVAKILKDIVFLDKNTTGGSGKITLSEDDKKIFYEAAKSYQAKNNVEFKG